MIPARTIRAQDGRALVFSCDDFVDQICLGDHCFICGDSPGSKPFNAEHVIPRWLLRRDGLFDKEITLPYSQVRTYGRSVLPCCSDCNSLLGRELETPVADLLGGGYEAIIARLDTSGLMLLFRWACLLFLKTHLKDRAVPLHPDPRQSPGRVADAYSWPELHHLHCAARTPFTQAAIDPLVRGSMHVFKIEDQATSDTFDYADLTHDQTLLVRIGDFGMALVLNDSGAATQAWADLWPKIANGPISTLQLREVAARLALANRDLINRPQYGSAFHKASDTVRLFAEFEGSGPVFEAFDPEAYGSLLCHMLQGHRGHLEIDGERDPGKLETIIGSGRVRFLLDDNDQFRPPQIVWTRTDELSSASTVEIVVADEGQ